MVFVTALAACAGGPPQEEIGPPPGMEITPQSQEPTPPSPGGGMPTLEGAPSLEGKTPSGFVRWEGPEALTPGKHTLAFDFKYDGLGFATLAFNQLSGIGQSGTGVLEVDGKAVATQEMAHTVPLILQWDETFDVGADTGTPVDDEDYQVPFAFTGTLTKLALSIDRPQLTAEDEKRLAEAQRNNEASE